jgi:DedD protein
MKRPLNAQEQALRIQSRRRMIGAAVIMLCVVLLLPMILDHSMGPKLAAPGLTPALKETQQDKNLVDPATVARSDLPQPAAAETPPAAASPSLPAEPFAAAETAAIPAPATAVVSTAAKPATQTAVPASNKTAYWVQVGVFSDRSKAQALIKKLADHEIHAVGEEAHYKDGARVRVRIGPLNNKAEAVAMTHQLDQLTVKSMVISP